MREHECNGKSQRRFISRRDLLCQAGEGMGGIALAYLLGQNSLLGAPAEGNQACAGSVGVTDSPFLPKQPHFKARAKSVISLFMCGGVSQVDTFDYKPSLRKYAGQELPPSFQFTNSGGRKKGFLTPAGVAA